MGISASVGTIQGRPGAAGGTVHANQKRPMVRAGAAKAKPMILSSLWGVNFYLAPACKRFDGAFVKYGMDLRLDWLLGSMTTRDDFYVPEAREERQAYPAGKRHERQRGRFLVEPHGLVDPSRGLCEEVNHTPRDARDERDEDHKWLREKNIRRPHNHYVCERLPAPRSWVSIFPSEIVNAVALILCELSHPAPQQDTGPTLPHSQECHGQHTGNDGCTIVNPSPTSRGGDDVRCVDGSDAESNRGCRIPEHDHPHAGAGVEEVLDTTCDDD